MVYYKKRIKNNLSSFKAFLIVILVLLALPCSYANEVLVKEAKLSLDEPARPIGLYLQVQYDFDLPTSLRKALVRGIPLVFKEEFQLIETRWYWFDRITTSRENHQRLSYSPLTERYSLMQQGVVLHFSHLEDALSKIQQPPLWMVATWENLKNPEKLNAKVRFSLDTEQLPKALNMTNTGTNKWTLSGQWSTLELPDDIFVSFDNE